jgi:RNA-directed DNA polymerase
VRWPKIVAKANPFDEYWQAYFEERETDKMLVSLKGREALTKLFYKQSELCPICGDKITRDTDFKLQYHKDGTRTTKTMGHPQCHDRTHTFVTEQPTS